MTNHRKSILKGDIGSKIQVRRKLCQVRLNQYEKSISNTFFPLCRTLTVSRNPRLLLQDKKSSVPHVLFNIEAKAFFVPQSEPDPHLWPLRFYTKVKDKTKESVREVITSLEINSIIWVFSWRGAAFIKKRLQYWLIDIDVFLFFYFTVII